MIYFFLFYCVGFSHIHLSVNLSHRISNLRTDHVTQTLLQKHSEPNRTRPVGRLLIQRPENYIPQHGHNIPRSELCLLLWNKVDMVDVDSVLEDSVRLLTGKEIGMTLEEELVEDDAP